MTGVRESVHHADCDHDPGVLEQTHHNLQNSCTVRSRLDPFLVLAEHHDSGVGGDPEGWKAVVHVDVDSPHCVQSILMGIMIKKLFQ